VMEQAIPGSWRRRSGWWWSCRTGRRRVEVECSSEACRCCRAAPVDWLSGPTSPVCRHSNLTQSSSISLRQTARVTFVVYLQELGKKLAATLHGSRPGVQSASPKTPKNTSFLGVTQPPGVAQPLYSRGHN